MIVVSDSGPLIALAKIDALSVLFGLYSEVLIPPSVLEETVGAGLRLGVVDAQAVEAFHAAGQLRVVALRPPTIHLPEEIDPGERDGILLALQEQADWLLVDDLRARNLAEEIFSGQRVKTRIRGTLGLLIEAFREGVLSQMETLDRLRSLEAHPEIWLHKSLIEWAIGAVSRQSV